MIHLKCHNFWDVSNGIVLKLVMHFQAVYTAIKMFYYYTLKYRCLYGLHFVLQSPTPFTSTRNGFSHVFLIMHIQQKVDKVNSCCHISTKGLDSQDRSAANYQSEMGLVSQK